MARSEATLPTEFFEHLETGLGLFDQDGQLSWANPALASLLATSPADLAAAPELQKMLSSPQQTLLIERDEREIWLDCEARANTDGTLLVVRDVSEQQQLAQQNQQLTEQVAELKLTDDLTGLPNRRAISQVLELQISRSRRYQNPLSLVMVKVSGENGPFGPDHADTVMLGVAHYLRDRLRWVDQIGRWDDNTFVLVLPETEKGDAVALIDKLQNEQSCLRIAPPLSHLNPELAFGLAHWSKGDDMRTLLRATSENLAHA